MTKVFCLFYRSNSLFRFRPCKTGQFFRPAQNSSHPEQKEDFRTESSRRSVLELYEIRNATPNTHRSAGSGRGVSSPSPRTIKVHSEFCVTNNQEAKHSRKSESANSISSAIVREKESGRETAEESHNDQRNRHHCETETESNVWIRNLIWLTAPEKEARMERIAFGKYPAPIGGSAGGSATATMPGSQCDPQIPARFCFVSSPELCYHASSLLLALHWLVCTRASPIIWTSNWKYYCYAELLKMLLNWPTDLVIPIKGLEGGRLMSTLLRLSGKVVDLFSRDK